VKADTWVNRSALGPEPTKPTLFLLLPGCPLKGAVWGETEPALAVQILSWEHPWECFEHWSGFCLMQERGLTWHLTGRQWGWEAGDLNGPVQWCICLTFCMNLRWATGHLCGWKPFAMAPSYTLAPFYI
jgi:hypothetical protein